MSNDQSAYEEDHDQFLLKQISRAKFKFDYIVDNTQSIAKSFDAQCTPDFFYFNNDNVGHANLGLRFRLYFRNSDVHFNWKSSDEYLSKRRL